MKWCDLTPDVLFGLATDLFDDAHDKKFERESIAEESGFDVVAALECVARRLRREATRRGTAATVYDLAPNMRVTYDGGWVFRWTNLPPNQNQPRVMSSLSEVVLWLWNEGQGLSHEEIDAVLPDLLALRRAARRSGASAAASSPKPTREDEKMLSAATAPGERVYEMGEVDDLTYDGDGSAHVDREDS